MPVQVDTRQFDKGVRQLAAGIADAAPGTAQRAANEVANRLRSRLPRRTGRLVGSVAVLPDGDGGYGVSYGAGVAYARPVAARTGAVADAIAGVPDAFGRDATAAAEKEVRRL
jgi:hypothetical protein